MAVTFAFSIGNEFVAQHPPQHLILSGFSWYLIFGILIKVYCYLMVVLTCIYLMVYDVECLFKWFLDIYISSLMSHPLEYFAHIFPVLFLFLLLSFKSLSYNFFIRYVFDNYVFPNCHLFIFLKVSFAENISLLKTCNKV